VRTYPCARVGLRTLKAHRTSFGTHNARQWRPLNARFAPQYLSDFIASIGVYAYTLICCGNDIDIYVGLEAQCPTCYSTFMLSKPS